MVKYFFYILPPKVLIGWPKANKLWWLVVVSSMCQLQMCCWHSKKTKVYQCMAEMLKICWLLMMDLDWKYPFFLKFRKKFNCFILTWSVIHLYWEPDSVGGCSLGLDTMGPLTLAHTLHTSQMQLVQPALPLPSPPAPTLNHRGSWSLNLCTFDTIVI